VLRRPGFGVASNARIAITVGRAQTGPVAAWVEAVSGAVAVAPAGCQRCISHGSQSDSLLTRPGWDQLIRGPSQMSVVERTQSVLQTAREQGRVAAKTCCDGRQRSDQPGSSSARENRQGGYQPHRNFHANPYRAGPDISCPHPPALRLSLKNGDGSLKTDDV
jgi:hypothetical protein